MISATCYWSELGDGWESARLESEVEFELIQEILKLDQDQDYFIGGSIYDETWFQYFYEWPYSFQQYSPRQSGIFFFKYQLISPIN